MAIDMPLGRGLGSLIPAKPPPAAAAPPIAIEAPPPSPAPVDTATEASTAGRIFDIPLGLIDPNPHQPRHNFGGEPLDELVSSIRLHGILQPLIATKRGRRYQLVAGERRFRAAQRLGLPSVPAIVREAREQEQLELAIVENVQRQDLNPVEEAIGYHQLSEEFGLTQEAIAHKVGKSRATVANAIRLLSLPAEMQQALRHGTITASHAKVLLTAITPDERQQLFERILSGKLPVRAAARLGQATTVRRYTRRRVDPIIQAKEDALRARLGTKVTITKREHRGTVAIEFYSDEEFDTLVNRLQAS